MLRNGVAQSNGMPWRNGPEQGGGIVRNQVAESPGILSGGRLMSKSLCLFFCVLLILGCMGRQTPSYNLDDVSKDRTIYLVSGKRHSGIVVKQSDIPKELWFEKKDFPNHELIEVGWGDREYYMAKEVTSGLGMKALFLPTSSVLHVVGFNSPIQDFFPDSKVFEFMVTAEGVVNVCQFIDNSYKRDSHQNSFCLGKGNYGDSKFYSAKGTFSWLNTCNTWSGRALKSAGVPIRAFLLISANDLQNEALKYGRVVQ